jgi:hypothetical protein
MAMLHEREPEKKENIEVKIERKGCDMACQCDPTSFRSYAQAAGILPSTTERHDVMKNYKTKSNANPDVISYPADVKDHKKSGNSVSTPRSGSSTGETNNRRLNSRPNPQFPKVSFINDSVCSLVNAKRVGRSFGFAGFQKRAFTVDRVVPAMNELVERFGSMDAVVIHTGINDLKRKEPAQVAKDLQKSVAALKAKYPKTKVLVSLLAPCRLRLLEKKRAVLNAMLVSEYYSDKTVALICHDNMSHVSFDGIHPTPRGSNIVGNNIGNVVESVLWERPKSKSEEWWRSNIEYY